MVWVYKELGTESKWFPAPDGEDPVLVGDLWLVGQIHRDLLVQLCNRVLGDAEPDALAFLVVAMTEVMDGFKVFYDPSMRMCDIQVPHSNLCTA